MALNPHTYEDLLFALLESNHYLKVNSLPTPCSLNYPHFFPHFLPFNDLFLDPFSLHFGTFLPFFFLLQFMKFSQCSHLMKLIGCFVGNFQAVSWIRRQLGAVPKSPPSAPLLEALLKGLKKKRMWRPALDIFSLMRAYPHLRTPVSELDWTFFLLLNAAPSSLIVITLSPAFPPFLLHFWVKNRIPLLL